MQFHDRKTELENLERIWQNSRKKSTMTFIVGRRRIGKTRLIRESLKDRSFLYLFIARKEERLLCEEFVQLAQEQLKMNIYGEIRQFKDLFALLMDRAESEHFTLVIDEFQEFKRINPSVFSDMQNIWDRKKEQTRMNLILCGSVYSIMQEIFENAREPLFGRADERLYIEPFTVEVQKEIQKQYCPGCSAHDLLAFYIFTGGVPKYIELFVDKGIFTYAEMLDEMLRPNSLFLEEGRNVLIEEFGKAYTTYFSILSLIASSKTSRREIESVLQKDIGGFLNRLENEYRLVKRTRPVFAKPGTRNVRYVIEDNFLNFWFRFIYKNRAAVEIGNTHYIKQIIDRDYVSFSGIFLEKYFREQLASTGEYAEIGNYWEKGHQNEIDIVALNPLRKRALIGEVKLNPKSFSLAKLREKTYNISRKLGGYEVEYRGFSLEDM